MTNTFFQKHDPGIKDIRCQTKITKTTMLGAGALRARSKEVEKASIDIDQHKIRQEEASAWSVFLLAEKAAYNAGKTRFTVGYKDANFEKHRVYVEVIAKNGGYNMAKKDLEDFGGEVYGHCFEFSLISEE